MQLTEKDTKGRNRGKHPSDEQLFNSKWQPALRAAVDDLSWLLSRAYGSGSALELVGNRYRLNKRQRKALLRMSASDQQVQNRRKKALFGTEVQGQSMLIDGFNVLILLENVLSGAFVFKCRDGLYRDISSVHGSYKRVIKTEEAILCIGKTLRALQVGSITWLLDSPVSNSGRLKTFLLEIGAREGFDWQVELVYSPDKLLSATQEVVVTSDGWVLDEAERWYNLGARIIENHFPDANIFS